MKNIKWLEVYAWVLIAIGVVILVGGAIEIYQRGMIIMSTVIGTVIFIAILAFVGDWLLNRDKQEE